MIILATKEQIEQKILDELYDDLNLTGTTVGETVMYYSKALAILQSMNTSSITSNLRIFYVEDNGTANTYHAVLPAVTGYATGDVYIMKALNANNNSCTFEVNSLGTKAIKKTGATLNFTTGDIRAGQMIILIYDGTQFQGFSF